MVASKAAGAKYGVSKKATLIPVKMTFDSSDIFEALELILEDLEDDSKAQGRGT